MPEAARVLRGEAPPESWPPPPPPPLPTMTLAEIYAAQGHLDRAIAVLDEVLARAPEDEDARRLRERPIESAARGQGAGVEARDADAEDADAEDADAEDAESAAGGGFPCLRSRETMARPSHAGPPSQIAGEQEGARARLPELLDRLPVQPSARSFASGCRSDGVATSPRGGAGSCGGLARRAGGAPGAV